MGPQAHGRRGPGAGVSSWSQRCSTSVHHAEVVAHRVGEPFGSLILAVAVTIIEVALIVTLTFAGKEGAETLARDTVFAAIMITLQRHRRCCDPGPDLARRGGPLQRERGGPGLAASVCWQP